MKFVYELRNPDGSVVESLQPWEVHAARVIGVQLWPDNAPGGEDELRIIAVLEDSE